MRITLILLFLLSSLNILALDENLLGENEKNTIQTFRQGVKSVVHVSSLKRVRRSFFDLTTEEIPTGTGTGFVWDDKGHIVTNYHVVQGAKRATVSFHNDKKEYRATVIGVEPSKDVAVLLLSEKPSNLYPVKLADSSKLIVGQKAMAIGNPFGLDHTITSGIVSALNRKIESIGGVSINGVIQTDASINPGNSGGPLLNSSGEVIGINTMIISPSGSSSGIGFAVPINEVKRAVPQLIKYGKMIRPILGIRPLPDEYKYRFGINKGIAILEISGAGPADTAGLKGIKRDRFGDYYLGDVILEMDGKEVSTYDDYFQIMDKKKLGDNLKLKIFRDNKTIEMTIKLNKVK